MFVILPFLLDFKKFNIRLKMGTEALHNTIASIHYLRFKLTKNNISALYNSYNAPYSYCILNAQLHMSY